MSESPKQQRRRKLNQAWKAAHPNYAAEYRARQRQLKAELGCSMNGTLPITKKPKEKIPYARPIRNRQQDPETSDPFYSRRQSEETGGREQLS
jgi:hypothetical protein